MEPIASVHVMVERKIPAPTRDQQANPQPFISSVFKNSEKRKLVSSILLSLTLCLAVYPYRTTRSPGRSFMKFDILVFFENLSKKFKFL